SQPSRRLGERELADRVLEPAARGGERVEPGRELARERVGVGGGLGQAREQLLAQVVRAADLLDRAQVLADFLGAAGELADADAQRGDLVLERAELLAELDRAAQLIGERAWQPRAFEIDPELGRT